MTSWRKMGHTQYSWPHPYSKQMRDFSVMPAIWCYSFERYNGILGSIDTNNKGTFEVTVLNRFLESVHLTDYVRRLAPSMGGEETLFLHELANNTGTTTTTAQLESADAMDIEEVVKDPQYMMDATGLEPILESTILDKNPKTLFMSRVHYQYLLEYYQNWENRKFTMLKLHGQKYQSLEAATSRGSHIQAMFWDSTEENINNPAAEPSFYAGQVLYYFQHDLATKGTHTFAMVQYYGKIAYQPLINAGVEVWNDEFDPLTFQSVLPISRIYAPFAVRKYKDENKIVAIPLEAKFYIN
ncbi:hypothetical protein BDA99DRAFT_566901 [Phascolomyces articulosus]|uniref:Uncharacterized protein n=1 Tax=Phascolomyces articulosus TaxID=60185 RepID=A0AAD5JL27_9FUNG|nr:hypothetical protein BDA99DRAFT_566901 [Phascolomyces articulosus]